MPLVSSIRRIYQKIIETSSPCLPEIILSISASEYAAWPFLKWLVTQKLNFVWVPPSVQAFFVIQHVPLNAWVSSYLDLEFHNSFMHIFDRFCGFLIQKGTNCEILNLNNRRHGRLKVHVINQKSLVLMRKTL